MDRLLVTGKEFWRARAPAPVKAAVRPIVMRLIERRAAARAGATDMLAGPGPLVVSGLIREARGVGRAARLTVDSFRAAGFSPEPHDLREVFTRGPGGQSRLPVEAPGGVWVLHCNAPEAVQAFASLDPASWRGRFRIGYWAYELPRVPAAWLRASRFFHEIWAPSRFVAEALTRSGVSTPVRWMPHVVGAGAGHAPPRPDRERFGIEPGAFAVLAIGDLASSATRKNLIGAIEIFRTAFPGPSGPVLVVKTMSRGGGGAFRRAALAAAGGRPDIRFLDAELTDAETASLIASVDLLLSPHRSEGFGLALAEAFLADVPVLATGWSGNLDFMRAVPELQIRHRLAPANDPDRVYRGAGAVWAEPDVADAAERLRTIAQQPHLRRALAARGRAAVARLAEEWSPERLAETPVGRFVRTG